MGTAPINVERRNSMAAALAEVDKKRDEATSPGYFGRAELILHDGFVVAVRFEQTVKIKGPTAAHKKAA